MLPRRFKIYRSTLVNFRNLLGRPPESDFFTTYYSKNSARHMAQRTKISYALSKNCAAAYGTIKRHCSSIFYSNNKTLSSRRALFFFFHQYCQVSYWAIQFFCFHWNKNKINIYLENLRYCNNKFNFKIYIKINTHSTMTKNPLLC